MGRVARRVGKMVGVAEVVREERLVAEVNPGLQVVPGDQHPDLLVGGVGVDPRPVGPLPLSQRHPGQVVVHHLPLPQGVGTVRPRGGLEGDLGIGLEGEDVGGAHHRPVPQFGVAGLGPQRGRGDDVGVAEQLARGQGVVAGIHVLVGAGQDPRLQRPRLPGGGAGPDHPRPLVDRRVEGEIRGVGIGVHQALAVVDHRVHHPGGPVVGILDPHPGPVGEGLDKEEGIDEGVVGRAGVHPHRRGVETLPVLDRVELPGTRHIRPRQVVRPHRPHHVERRVGHVEDVPGVHPQAPGHVGVGIPEAENVPGVQLRPVGDAPAGVRGVVGVGLVIGVAVLPLVEEDLDPVPGRHQADHRVHIRPRPGRVEPGADRLRDLLVGLHQVVLVPHYVVGGVPLPRDHPLRRRRGRRHRGGGRHRGLVAFRRYRRRRRRNRGRGGITNGNHDLIEVDLRPLVGVGFLVVVTSHGQGVSAARKRAAQGNELPPRIHIRSPVPVTGETVEVVVPPRPVVDAVHRQHRVPVLVRLVVGGEDQAVIQVDRRLPVDGKVKILRPSPRHPVDGVVVDVAQGDHNSAAGIAAGGGPAPALVGRLAGAAEPVVGVAETVAPAVEIGGNQNRAGRRGGAGRRGRSYGWRHRGGRSGTGSRGDHGDIVEPRSTELGPVMGSDGQADIDIGSH